MKNLLRYIENKENRRLAKNSSSDGSIKSKRVRQIGKPSICWINTLAKPNTAYAYYNEGERQRQSLTNRKPRVDTLDPNPASGNRQKNGPIHNEKKISFSSNVTNLDLFDITNC
jgi:hypothetical protein